MTLRHILWLSATLQDICAYRIALHQSLQSDIHLKLLAGYAHAAGEPVKALGEGTVVTSAGDIVGCHDRCTQG